jgi:hypothetical protein
MPDVITETLDGYLRLFGNYGTFGSAMVGATLFIQLRATGILRDKDFAEPKSVYLIWLGGLAGLLLIAANFMAQNVILTFHVSIIDPVSNTAACKYTGDAAAFFTDCTRWKLRFFASLCPLVALFGAAMFVIWFFVQPKFPKKTGG